MEVLSQNLEDGIGLDAATGKDDGWRRIWCFWRGHVPFVTATLIGVESWAEVGRLGWNRRFSVQRTSIRRS